MCRRDGFTRRAIQRRPPGQFPALVIRPRDLRDVLVVLGGAVLAGAGLPRAGGDLADGVLVGGGDHPPAGEQHGPPRGGQGQQVLHELVAGAGPVDADEDLAAGTGPGPAGSRRPAPPYGR